MSSHKIPLGDLKLDVELPAIDSPPAILPSGQPLWPEFWSLKELEATRNAISVSKWQAQYQHNFDPTDTCQQTKSH